MQEELRRSNSIGTAEGIEQFITLVFDDQITGIDALYQAFRYHSLAQFNCYLAVLFFKELKLIEVFKDTIALTESGIEIAKLSLEQRKSRISELIFDILLQNKHVNCEHITVDPITGKLKIPTNAFVLDSAIYRNFLYEIGYLSKKSHYFVLNNKKLQDQVEAEIIVEKKKTTQKELLLKLQKQQEDGAKGEQFVLEYEMRRLLNHKLLPKRVSDIDVSAGYDILSCHDTSSISYDRYIEVKSYSGTPHFYWSSNEMKTAEVLGEKYYLYLVDLSAIEKNGIDYTPQIIANPAKELCGDDWLIEPNSYLVKSLSFL